MTESERTSARCALNSMELEAFGLARDLSDAGALTTYALWVPASALHAVVQICTRPNATRGVYCIHHDRAVRHCDGIHVHRTARDPRRAGRVRLQVLLSPLVAARCLERRVIGSPRYLLISRVYARAAGLDATGGGERRRRDARTRRAPRHRYSVRYTVPYRPCVDLRMSALRHQLGREGRKGAKRSKHVSGGTLGSAAFFGPR